MKSYSDTLPDFDKVKASLEGIVEELGNIVKEQNEQTQTAIISAQQNILSNQARQASAHLREVNSVYAMTKRTYDEAANNNFWIHVAVALGVLNLLGLAGTVAWYLHRINII